MKRSPLGREEQSRQKEGTRTITLRSNDEVRQTEIRSRRDGPSRRVKTNQRDGREVINIITGGFAGGGSSSLGRKKHLRAIQLVNSIAFSFRPRMPPITFTDQDFKEIDPA